MQTRYLIKANRGYGKQTKALRLLEAVAPRRAAIMSAHKDFCDQIKRELSVNYFRGKTLMEIRSNQILFEGTTIDFYSGSGSTERLRGKTYDFIFLDEVDMWNALDFYKISLYALSNDGTLIITSKDRFSETLNLCMKDPSLQIESPLNLSHLNLNSSFLEAIRKLSTPEEDGGTGSLEPQERRETTRT
jgi:hypothetical protein